MINERVEEQYGKRYFLYELERNRDKLLEASSPEHSRVERVFQRIISGSDYPINAWELHVINDPQRQAYILPGGKVFVHTGMLDMCERDDELAIILSHEIMHNVMHHASENLSEAAPLLILHYMSSFITGLHDDLTGMAIEVAFCLPRSRTQESEADYHGLLLAAKSDYDPAAALTLWSRWFALDEVHGPEYLRTHPSHRKRLNQFNMWLSVQQHARVTCDSEGTLSEDKSLVRVSADWKPSAGDFERTLHLQREYCGTERCPEVVVAPDRLTWLTAMNAVSHPVIAWHRRIHRHLSMIHDYILQTLVWCFGQGRNRAVVAIDEMKMVHRKGNVLEQLDLQVFHKAENTPRVAET